MGIRMHIAVGYGLDLNMFGDDRADRSKLGFERLEDEDLFSAFREDVFSWAEQNDDIMERAGFHPGMKPPTAFYQMVTYDAEFGLDDKVLLTPAGQHNNWHRYGNLLDAFIYESQQGSSNELSMVPEWILHPGTLYPYVGLMRPSPDKPLGVEKYWESCFRDMPEHKNAIAWAPWHLWFLIKHLGLWPEDKTTEAFLGLRPVIYRYWS